MIFGIGMIVIGYAVLYWGMHHFCGVDCVDMSGKNLGCACRYSLVDLLGLDKFGIGKGKALSF